MSGSGKTRSSEFTECDVSELFSANGYSIGKIQIQERRGMYPYKEEPELKLVLLYSCRLQSTASYFRPKNSRYGDCRHRKRS